MKLYDLSLDDTGSALRVIATKNSGLTGLGAFVVNTVGAIPLTWFAELDNAQKRLGDIHQCARAMPALEIWARAYAQRLNVNSNPAGVPFNENRYGFNAGLDLGGRLPSGNSLYIGGYIGQGRSTRRINNNIGNGDTTTLYGGLYTTFTTPSGWYLDVLLKYNDFKHDYTTTDGALVTSSNYKNIARGASIETGKRIPLNTRLTLEPQLQCAYVQFPAAGFTTNSLINVSITSGDSSQIRAGALLAYKKKSTPTTLFQPYAKFHLAQQWHRGHEINVEGDTFATSLKGFRVETGFGLNWQITKPLQAYFDYEATFARNYTKPYALSAGITYAW